MLQKLYELFLQFGKKIVTRFVDPMVTAKVNGYPIKCRLSHDLALKDTAQYNVLMRLAHLVHKTKRLKMIDVGAHIGACAVSIHSIIKDGAFLCIEGNPSFYDICSINLKEIPTAVLSTNYVSDVIEERSISINTYASTGNIMPSQNGNATKLLTVDFIADNHGFEVNLLKTDCDGYDFRALKGSVSVLRKYKPVVFFEFSPIHQLFHNIEENPSDVFNYLYDLGYVEYFVYSNTEFLMFKASISDLPILKQIERFALGSVTHYDILTFHSDDISLQNQYWESELKLSDEYIDKRWASYRKRFALRSRP